MEDGRHGNSFPDRHSISIGESALDHCIATIISPRRLARKSTELTVNGDPVVTMLVATEMVGELEVEGMVVAGVRKK